MSEMVQIQSKKNLQVAVKIPIYLQIYKEEGGITKYQYKGKNLASWVSLIVVVLHKLKTI